MLTTTARTRTPSVPASQGKRTSSAKAHPPVAAKRAAIAKAKATAPHVAANMGSTPKTKFRGDPNIFGRLVEDHDLSLIHISEPTRPY